MWGEHAQKYADCWVLMHCWANKSQTDDHTHKQKRKRNNFLFLFTTAVARSLSWCLFHISVFSILSLLRCIWMCMCSLCVCMLWFLRACVWPRNANISRTSVENINNIHLHWMIADCTQGKRNMKRALCKCVLLMLFAYVTHICVRFQKIWKENEIERKIQKKNTRATKMEKCPKEKRI